MRNVLVLTSLMMSAPQVLAAPVEADLVTGRRWAETKAEGESTGTQMNEVTFAGRYKIADTGLSVGPAVSFSSYRALGEDTTASNYELGLEAKYARPVTEKLTPFGKVRYVGYSKGTLKTGAEDVDVTANFRTYGVHLDVGAAYALTENIQLTGEVGYGVQMMRVTGGKAKLKDGSALADADLDFTGTRKEDFNSKALMLGVNVSI